MYWQANVNTPLSVTPLLNMPSEFFIRKRKRSLSEKKCPALPVLDVLDFLAL